MTEVNFRLTHKYPGTDVPNWRHLPSPNSCAHCDTRYVALALESRGLLSSQTTPSSLRRVAQDGVPRWAAPRLGAGPTPGSRPTLILVLTCQNGTSNRSQPARGCRYPAPCGLGFKPIPLWALRQEAACSPDSDWAQ